MSTELLEKLTPVLVNILILAVPALVGVLVYFAVPYLRALHAEVQARLTENQYYLIRSVVSTLIHSAEQLTGLDTNEKKRRYVLDMAATFAARYNIPISEDELDALLEGILKEIKLSSTAGLLAHLQEAATVQETVAVQRRQR
jgi:hypothetical protein